MASASLRFLLLAGLLEVALCTFGNHVYVTKKLNWWEARKHCRRHYTDLSADYSPWIEDKPNHSSGWIGLYKDANDTWKWSGANNESMINLPIVDDTNGETRCVLKFREKWSLENCCTKRIQFFCFNSSLILVKENKTWEEALEDCRQRGGDLVSPTSESALKYTLQSSRTAQTKRVWISLRYLAGSWLWTDKNATPYSSWNQEEVPQCPSMNQHCGALSLEQKHWQNWNCADKFNFICHVEYTG